MKRKTENQNKLLSIEEQADRFKQDFKVFQKKKKTFKRYKINIPLEEFTPKKIKEIREQKLNISQKVLADSLGVSVRTIQGWEIGRSRPMEPIIRLILLMRDEPAVRKRLLSIAS